MATKRISKRTGKAVRPYTRKTASANPQETRVAEKPFRAHERVEVLGESGVRVYAFATQDERDAWISGDPVRRGIAPTKENLVTGSVEGDRIYQDAYHAMCQSVHGIAGMFDAESARSCVRAVRALISEVQHPTKVPTKAARTPAAAADGHAVVEELDDELAI